MMTTSGNGAGQRWRRASLGSRRLAAGARDTIAGAWCAALVLAAPAARAQPDAGAPVNLQQAMTELAGALAEKYAPLATTALARLAVLDFDQIGDDVKARELGSVVAQLLGTRLTDKGVRLVERSRLAELVKEIQLQQTAQVDPATAQQVGRFLGAQALVVGAVSQAGAEFIVSARLVEVESGAVLLASEVSLPREGLIAFAEEAVEKRSKQGAIFRAMIPGGWGQFYNGPEHAWKGWTIAGSELLGLAAGVSALVIGSGKAADATEFGNTGFVAWCAEQGFDGLNCSGQAALEKELRDSEAQAFMLVGYGALAVFGVAYLWGIIDAAVYGQDYQGVRVAVTPVLDPAGLPLGASAAVTIPLGW